MHFMNKMATKIMSYQGFRTDIVLFQILNILQTSTLLAPKPKIQSTNLQDFGPMNYNLEGLLDLIQQRETLGLMLFMDSPLYHFGLL